MKSMFRSLDRASKLSFVRKFYFGLIIGVTIGWVLWQRMRAEQDDLSRATPATPAEIDITEPRLSGGKGAGLPAKEAKDAPEAMSTPKRPAKSDDLKAILGIGPVFARRLNEAGIRTFADLAAQEPQRLVEIVQAKAWQALDAQSWIAQAQELASD